MATKKTVKKVRTVRKAKAVKSGKNTVVKFVTLTSDDGLNNTRTEVFQTAAQAERVVDGEFIFNCQIKHHKVEVTPGGKILLSKGAFKRLAEARKLSH